jgi:hypothetical protein
MEHFYDNLGRQTEERWMNGATPVRSLTFDYYADGQLKSADDDGPEGRDYDWFYDAMGRLKETKWRAADLDVPFDYTLINKYDANSRRSERIVHVDPEDPYVPTDLLRDWWYYDDLGRVVTQDQRDNLFNWRRATYTYFADSQLDTMDCYRYDSPNWTKLLTTKWTYDGAGRIDDLKHFKADGTTLLAGYGYGFDAAGRTSDGPIGFCEPKLTVRSAGECASPRSCPSRPETVDRRKARCRAL